MSDDDGTFTFGTALNKAFLDAVFDTIDDQTHSTINPTVKPKAITDEVITARGAEANLAAKLATLVSTNYLLGTSDLGTTWKVAGGRSLQFDDADVAHGMTGIAPTSVWGSIDEISGTQGGLMLTGLSDVDQRGLQLYGINGSGAPANAAMTIVGAKKSGVGAVALAATEEVIGIYNYLTRVLRFMGDGSIELGDPASASSSKLQFDTNDYLQYNRAANIFNVVIGAVGVLSVYPTQVIIVPNGTAAAPGLSNGDLNSGLYRPNAGELGLVANGTELIRLLATTDVQWMKAQVALGGGAAPTLGTIGGTGPAAAAQNSWLRIKDSTGAAMWIPCWK